MRRAPRGGRAGPAAVLALHALLAVMAGAGAAEAGPPSNPESPRVPWWRGDPAPQGMITVSYSLASDSAGPSNRGLRVAYGVLTGVKADYPWAELWASFRQEGDFDLTGAGLSAVPRVFGGRRLGLGLLLDLGVSRRRARGRTVLAGAVGAGVEGVVRLARRWDLVPTVEAMYRTTADTEVQLRLGIRFHHEKLPSLGQSR